MITNSPSDGTRGDTAGGLLMVLLFSIHPAELAKTAVLAAIGATVSFAVSLILRWLHRRYRN